MRDPRVVYPFTRGGWGSIAIFETPGADTLDPGRRLARSFGSETMAVRQDPIRMYPPDPPWAVSFEYERQRLTLGDGLR